MEDWGFTRIYPSPSWPRRLLREEYPGRFSDSPPPSAAFPSYDNFLTVAIDLPKGFPFSFQKRSGTTAAGPSPILPIKAGMTGFPSPGYYFSIS
jgi:hypothetical protein